MARSTFNAPTYVSYLLQCFLNEMFFVQFDKINRKLIKKGMIVLYPLWMLSCCLSRSILSRDFISSTFCFFSLPNPSELILS